ncbi:MAG: hypothetical protein M3Q84_06495, partial [Actinomycetota bacterium]|nr:hypothetical protein [Actinomycetota bacterium]
YSVELAGSDVDSARGTFLLRDSRAGDGLPFRLTVGRVQTNTFGPVRDIADPLADLPATTYPAVMAYDATARVAGIGYVYDFFAPPPIQLVDLRAGTAELVDHTAQLAPVGLDLLGTAAGTGDLVFTSFDGSLQAVDLADGGVQSVAVPDGIGYFVAADDENGLVLVAQPNSDPTGQDKNHLSSVRVFDADLGLVSTVQRFNLYNTPLSAAVRQLQVDPSTRTGWFVGPLQQQVAVFPY